MAPKRDRAWPGLLNIISGNQSEVLLSMYKAAWERPVAPLLALSKAVRVRTRLLFVGRASENAVSLQMRGFYKAKDTENGHICKSSHAVYKSDLSCMRVSLNSASPEAMRHTDFRNNTRE